MTVQPQRPATPQTREIIGLARVEKLQAIRSAIEGTGTSVLQFVGAGGIGKTRQLREVARWHLSQREGAPIIKRSFEWLGLIDLYHSDLHTPSVIERQIVARIDPDFETCREQSPFKDYLDKRDSFEERRRQGLASEKERAELTRIFVDDYNKWAASHRAVIAFDTLELIVYEEDPVIKICEGEAGSADVKGWLLEVLPLLQNTVILLANRPHPRLEAEFEECFKSVPYQRFELTVLSEEDTLAYLKDIVAQRPDIGERFEEPGREPTDVYREIWQYTRGVPILISLVIDLAAFGDVGALQSLRGMGDPEDEKKVRELLVNELKKIKPPIWDTLRCLAVARKGLTPELFERLMADKGWSLEQCQGELDRLREATFIKSREGSAALFLHDALYEMLDELKPSALVDPGRLLPVIIAYYEEQIQACEKEINDIQAKLHDLNLRERTGPIAPDELAQRRVFQDDLARRKRERQQLQVESVYYRLWYDPQQGFESYVHLYNEALKAHEFGFEARLHDEVLRYLSSTLYTESRQAQKRIPLDRFNRHCGLRWVKFHLARADREGYERAARVAQRILEAAEPPLGGAEARADLLYQAELRLWRAEALIYLGHEQEAEKWLKDSLGFLQRARARGLYRRWRLSRLIGRAHNDLGYIYRSSQRYRASIREYRKAITRFREADIRDELADTLNNLAYVYGILGETGRAKALAEDARQLREQLGQSYPLALTYNTTGEIHTAANEPEEAEVWCERARAIFATMEDARGLGLAYIGLGRAKRKLGDKSKRSQVSFGHAQCAFEAAVDWLSKALGVFGGDAPPVKEPYRLWETLNELGSTYMDWAYLLNWHGLREQAEEKYRLSVQYQEQAAEVVADKPDFVLQKFDSYDDLAYVYAEWGDLDRAKEYLDKVYRGVPAKYKLVKGKGFRKLADPVDGYWLVLGKYHLQHAIWARKEAARTEPPSKKDRLLNESARHFALAMAYFQQFWPAQTYIQVTSRTMYQHFKTLGSERLKRLRGEVQKVARQYRVNLGRLLDTLDDMLGSPIP